MKKMKKVISAILVATMVMSMGMTAFADNTDGDDSTTIETTTISDYKSAVIENTKPINFKFTKKYVTSVNTDPAKYPAETLRFNVSVTEGYTNPGTEMLQIQDQTVDANPDDILVTVPVYKNVGRYYYTVSEKPGNTQGVTYSTNTFNVQVLVTWNSDHSDMQRQISFTSAVDGKKVDEIENIYDLGSLTVNKTVTGNLGNQEMQFKVKVTFNATKDVKSEITYKDLTGEHTIPVEKMSDGTETVEITVAHGTANSCVFTNIPEGVTYTVVENDYVTQKDLTVSKENDEYGYDAPVYANSDNAVTATGSGKIDHTRDTDNNITGTDADTVGITNNKETNVSTGISLDNMPYIMVLALVALGLVGFVSKKRSMEF